MATPAKYTITIDKDTLVQYCREWVKKTYGMDVDEGGFEFVNKAVSDGQYNGTHYYVFDRVEITTILQPKTP